MTAVAAENVLKINSELSQQEIEEEKGKIEALQEDEIDLNPAFLLPKCEFPPTDEYQPVEAFVAKAVADQHLQHDDSVPTATYKGILEALKTKQDLKMLRKILLALRTSEGGATMHRLTISSSKHTRLIHMILRLNPFELVKDNTVDIDLATAQLHLILALVSANSVFLLPSLTALWKMLILSQYETIQEDRTCLLHAAIASILRLCPKGKSELFPILSTNSPFRTKPKLELVWYYQQCLAVLQYLPSIQGQVLEFLVDKCLEMDVEIVINDTGEVSIDEASTSGNTATTDDGIFELDEENTNEKVPSEDIIAVDEMADKLDALMLLLFQYTSTFSEEKESAEVLYDIFLRVFESSIIITHKSKFVQFLMLYVCGLDTMLSKRICETPVTLYRDYAAKLIDIVLDPYRATVTRQTGACYLASFISRASFVSAETVCESVSALLRWAEAYMEALVSSQIHMDDARGQCSLHSLFYTVSQAAFYIMCFRGTEAVAFYRSAVIESAPLHVDNDLIDISSERWTKLCSHPMQPLRFCLESVRSEFLSVSRVYGLVELAVLEGLTQEVAPVASSRHRLKPVVKICTPATLEKERLRGGVGGLGKGHNPLDSFFPYDPYLLRNSHRFIEPFYNHWSGSIEHKEYGEEEDDTQNASIGSDHDTSDSSGSDVEDDTVEERHSFQPMSFASVATSYSSTSSALHSTPDIAVNKEALRSAWTDTLKRARAPSIENGSW